MRSKHGVLLTGQRELKREASTHFEILYGKKKSISLEQDFKVLKLYSHFFSFEEGRKVVGAVILEELKVLKNFLKERSPGPNG